MYNGSIKGMLLLHYSVLKYGEHCAPHNHDNNIRVTCKATLEALHISTFVNVKTNTFKKHCAFTNDAVV
jgi:hypothetical protein